MVDNDKILRMYDLVGQWQSSGKSQKQFSQDHGIKLPTFMYWIKKYRMRKQVEAGFARIEMSDGLVLPTTPRIELALADGMLIRIY